MRNPVTVVTNTNVDHIIYSYDQNYQPAVTPPSVVSYDDTRQSAITPSVLSYSQAYQPAAISSVYLNQIPSTGFADNLKLYFFMGVLAFLSAWIAYIFISYKKNRGELY